MLELRDSIALNFLDLKRNFSLSDICRQQEMFLRFAQVHCLPVKTWAWNRAKAREAGKPEDRALYFGPGYSDDRYEYYCPVNYLKRSFWFWLFCRSMDRPGSDKTWSDILTKLGENPDLSDCMGLVKALVKLQLESPDDSDLEDLEKKFPSEWRNCWLDEQSEAVMALLEERDVRKFCLLLSIVQLAEQDASAIEREVRPRREDASRQEPQESILPFPERDGTAQLEAGRVYCLPMLERDCLNGGEEIRTVALRVGESQNPYLTACLRVSGADGTRSVELPQGCCLYCTMTSSGELIHILPPARREGGQKLGRRNVRDPALCYVCEGARPVVVMSGGDAALISSFALDPSAPPNAASFLYLINGKVYTDCYEKYQNDYNTRSSLMEVKYGRYAEVAFTGDGCYLLLGTNGIIRSNDAAMDGKRAVSLDAGDALAEPEYLEG